MLELINVFVEHKIWLVVVVEAFREWVLHKKGTIFDFKSKENFEDFLVNKPGT